MSSQLTYDINDLIGNSVPEALGTPDFTSENTPAFSNGFTDGISSSDLVAGELHGNTIVTDGYLKSSNFSSGAAGWQLTPTSAEINVSTALLSLDIPDNISANSFHVDSSGNVWWGAILIGDATGKVLNTGVATFSDMNITGGSVAAATLNGLVALSNTNVSAQGWTFTGAFSSVDYNTIAWATGTFTTAGGTAYSITGANTGNMAATTYIYLDIAVSTTLFQVTTTAATAVGSGKVLIAVASVNSDTTSDAMVQVFGGTGGQIMSVENLAANSASTNEFVSNTAQIANLAVTNAKINDLAVSKLTAGTITSKAITLAVSDGTGDTKIQAGKNDFGDTAGGFILGVDDSVVGNPAKFEIGNATDYLNWSGTKLSVAGQINLGGTNITVGAIADVQTALDDVATAGGGTVYLQPGTYTLTADISIQGGCALEGVSRDEVIIDGDGSFGLKIVGTNPYSTGTVTISNGDTEVVGDSTVWTSGMVGRYILLDGYWYLITARTNDTHITIDAYVGGDLAGATYVLADVNFTAKIQKVTVQNTTGSGITVSYVMEPTINDAIIIDCGVGIDMDYVVFPRILVSSNYNTTGLNMNYVEGYYIDWSEFNFNTGNGITMTNSGNATLFNSSINDNGGNGLSITDGSKATLISCDVSGNTGIGLEYVSGCDDNQVMASVFDTNGSDGIKLTATSDRNSLSTCSITNSGGYGVNVAASTCDNNYIIAPSFDTNASGNINDAGTDTSIIQQTDIVNDVQIFTTSGTWTKPAGARIVYVTLIGAGGGGASLTGNPGGGGGGGGGISCGGPYYADTLATTLSVVVSSSTAKDANGADTTFNGLTAGGGQKGSGATGGVGGTNTNGVSGGNGGNGGTALYSNGGGSGGGGGAAGSNGTSGGNASQDFQGTAGFHGDAGTTMPPQLGDGGDGKAGNATAQNGSPGSNYGGGGGGGTHSGSAPTGDGGTGGGGYAIITSYL